MIEASKTHTACGHLRSGQARCGLCDKCLNGCCECTQQDREDAYALFKTLFKEHTGIDLTLKKRRNLK